MAARPTETGMLVVTVQVHGDLRARFGPDPHCELKVGVIGTEPPRFSLIPATGQSGQRPAHRIARSHRIEGEGRALEELGDPMLDALDSFPLAKLRVWPAGALVDLGPSPHHARVDDLEALIRAAASL